MITKLFTAPRLTLEMLITAFDTYLTPRSPEAWYQVWVPRPTQAPSGV